MSEINNLDMGLYYDPDKKCYFRGYDKDKTIPLNKDGVYVIIDQINIKDNLKVLPKKDNE